MRNRRTVVWMCITNFYSLELVALHSAEKTHTHTLTPCRTRAHKLRATTLFMTVTGRSQRVSCVDLWVPKEPHSAVTATLSLTVTEVSFWVKLIHHEMWPIKTKWKIGKMGWLNITLPWNSGWNNNKNRKNNNNEKKDEVEEFVVLSFFLTLVRIKRAVVFSVRRYCCINVNQSGLIVPPDKMEFHTLRIKLFSGNHIERSGHFAWMLIYKHIAVQISIHKLSHTHSHSRIHVHGHLVLLFTCTLSSSKHICLFCFWGIPRAVHVSPRG